MDLLRFITAGSINDGKSTLIGRLLYNTYNIKQDILDSLYASGHKDDINLAFLTDGLRSEREQGVTIDVAYKYFSTAKRDYTIIDAPGHFKYTRNFVSGASNVNLIIILVDARNGITEQTKRHTHVASFLKIPTVIVAVNKMDLVEFDELLFRRLQEEYLSLASKLQLPDVRFIPISALNGDNISDSSVTMPWYTGKTLLEYLETLALPDNDNTSLRLSVQCTIGTNLLAKILSGRIRQGDTVAICPGGKLSVVEEIVHGFKKVKEAGAGQNIVLSLTKGVEVKRGDIISNPHDPPVRSTDLTACICWLDQERALEIDKDYILRINSFESKCRIVVIEYRIDNNKFERLGVEGSLSVNEFASVRIKVNAAIAYDLFTSLQATGKGILIDEETNNTSGAFVITAAGNINQ